MWESTNATSHRPFCPFPHRPATCRLASGGAGQLAGRPRPWRPVAGPHRGRGHTALRARGRPTHHAAARSMWPAARRRAALPVGTRRALPGSIEPAHCHRGGLPLRLHAPGYCQRAAGSRPDTAKAQRAGLPRHLPERTARPCGTLLAAQHGAFYIKSSVNPGF